MAQELVKWETEMELAAVAAAETEEGGGQFFSLKSGQLSWNDNPIPNNEMAVVILDGIHENVYYAGEYDPDNIEAPTCYAFGRKAEDMAPHKNVIKPPAATCEDCPNNKWGSADKGKGKACQNRRRLAMIPAGVLDNDGKLIIADDFKADVGFMKLNVMSVRGYSSFVKGVAATLKRPPYGIITKVVVVSDPKSQFRVLFKPMQEIPTDSMQEVWARHEEVAATIDFPYTVHEEAKPVKKGKKY